MKIRFKKQNTHNTHHRVQLLLFLEDLLLDGMALGTRRITQREHVEFSLQSNHLNLQLLLFGLALLRSRSVGLLRGQHMTPPSNL